MIIITSTPFLVIFLYMQHAMRENTKVSKNAHKKAHASLHKRVLIEKERHNMPSVNYLQKNN